MQSGLSQKGNKKFWVKVKWVTNYTGWTKEELRQARLNGWITWRHSEEDGWEYDLNSIDERMIKREEDATI